MITQQEVLQEVITDLVGGKTWEARSEVVQCSGPGRSEHSTSREHNAGSTVLGRVIPGRDDHCFLALLFTPNRGTLTVPAPTLPSLVTHRQSPLLTQRQFGRNAPRCPGEFCLFQSETKNLLFNDNTECLAKLHGKNTSEKYLGKEYVTATAHLKQCSSSRECALDIITGDPTRE